MQDLSKYSFGATSAITTSLAIIAGLDATSNPKMSIIGALLILAVADNISDSLGIHVYRESQQVRNRNSGVYAISNFLTRLMVTLIFVALVMFLPLRYAIASSIILGLALLSLLSYLIAVNHKTNPYSETIYHVGVAIAVLLASHFLGQTIASIFKM